MSLIAPYWHGIETIATTCGAGTQAVNELLRTEYEFVAEMEEFLRQYATPLRQLTVRPPNLHR